MLEGHVVVCASHKDLLLEVEKDIIKHYDSKPLVIVHNSDKGKDLSMIIKANKFRHFKSVTAETLEEIKDIH